MENEFDIIKWRNDNPMDYLLAMDLINSATNKNEVFHAIYQITRLYLPDTLFKFISLTEDTVLNKSKLDTLQRQQVYMSDVKDLNDPHDNRAYFYSQEVLKKYERLSLHDGMLIDDFSAFTKVASFTINNENSMPMWAHYSNNHSGFCLAYDMNDKRNVQLAGNTFPVQYIDKRIDVTDLMDNQVKNTIMEIENQIVQGRKEIILDDPSLIFMVSLLGNIKHEGWGYEKEFRCSVGATAKGMPFLSAVPKEIYIGMKCSDAHSEELVKIANGWQIPIFRMAYDERNVGFNLNLKRISI